MRKLLAAAVLVLSAFTISADTTPAPKPKVKSKRPLVRRTEIEAVRRITRLQARRLVRMHKGFYVDVRSAAAYGEGHIAGAVNIPYGTILEHLDELPKDQTIITYCACGYEHSSALTVLDLTTQGFPNAAALLDGWDGWVKEKLPTETTPHPLSELMPAK